MKYRGKRKEIDHIHEPRIGDETLLRLQNPGPHYLIKELFLLENDYRCFPRFHLNAYG
jgi:hypothetical protein